MSRFVLTHICYTIDSDAIRRVMELEKENKKLQNQIQKLYGDLYNKE